MDSDDSIAIVGIGCIFPGANNIEDFWRVLENGEDHVQDIPRNRFNVEAYYDADPDHPKKTYVRKAGLIDSYDEWDNRFFGISDKEAERVDPQQFMVLETVHMALEDAGITKSQLNQSDTGVYIGAMNHDWKCILRASGEDSTNSTVTGVDSSIISARVSYFYNLTGPAVTIETACSSSLVTVHIASQALLTGDASMAICGGVSCIMDPGIFIILSSARMASPTGKCHAFSDDADGYARGEGCGIVILKRLCDAKRDKNKIWGTIKTGLNQDGRMNTPITAPSGVQQTKLMEKLYKECKIQPGLIQYIEAHGTGTQVGDFTEVNALGKFFSEERNFSTKLGSVKTNIGHLESAAGIAGLIKILLMMKHEMYVPSLHADVLNPKIPFDEYKFSVSKKACAWHKTCNGKRIACMNCFGFGGTNSHAIIESCDDSRVHKKTKSIDCDTFLSTHYFVLLSAENKYSLTQSALNLKESLLQFRSMRIEDISSTSIYHRSSYSFKKLFSVTTVEDLQTQLEQFCKNNFDTAKTSSSEGPQLIFVYCGVGTTWKNMCQQLLQFDRPFRNVIDQIDFHLQSITDIRVSSIFEGGEDISDPLRNHLAIFACQIGLTESLKYIGIKPYAVVGQSVGEVAVAYSCGSLSLSDAVKVIYYRSWYLSQERTGEMMIVQKMAIEDVERECSYFPLEQPTIAVYHSNASCVVSGSVSAIAKLKDKLSKLGAKLIPLNVKHAYHSQLVKRSGEYLKSELQGLLVKAPSIKTFSSVSGTEMTDAYFGCPEYWEKNIVRPVLFQLAITNAHKSCKNPVFVEIGPRPVLKAHLSNIFPDSEEICIPTLQKHSELESFRNAFETLVQYGCHPKWENIVEHTDGILTFPKYIFNRRKCLVLSEKISVILEGIDTEVQNRMVKLLPGTDMTFVVHVNKYNTEFVYQHIVDSNIIVPGALYGEIGLEISKHLSQANALISTITWTIKKPLAIKDKDVEICVTTKSEKDGFLTFEALSSSDSSCLASGFIKQMPCNSKKSLEIERLRFLLDMDTTPCMIYTKLRDLGFQHGPLFQTIEKSISRENEIVSKLCVSDELIKHFDRTSLHPVIIDSMFQSCLNFDMSARINWKTRLFPVQIRGFQLYQHPEKEMICYTKAASILQSSVVFNILLLTLSGEVVAEIKEFEVDIIDAVDDIQDVSFRENWQPLEVETMPLKFTKTIILFSWNACALNSIKHAIQKETGDLEILTVVMTEENEKMRLLPSQHIGSDIIFVPEIGEVGEMNTGKEICKKITKSCHYFLAVLKKFYNVDIRVIVLTKNTQNLTKADKVSLFGSELWGMARSASQEGTSLKFTLIDFHGEIGQNINDIVRMISYSLTLPAIHIPHEFSIANGIVYCNQIEKMPKTFFNRIFHKKNPIQGSPNLQIKKDHLHGDSYFGVPCYGKTGEQTKCKIKPHLALISSEQKEGRAKSCHLPEEYHAEDENKGHNIHVFEIIGSTSVHGQEIEVIACCQQDLKTEMAIDKKCVITKSDVPNYRVGDIYYVSLANSIADVINRKSVVFINYDEQTSIIVEFLNHILLDKKCRIEHFVASSTPSIHSLEATHVVVLTQFFFKMGIELKLFFPQAKSFISFRGLISNRVSSTFTNNDNLHVINIDKMFNPHNLCNIIQNAVRLLTSTCKNYLKCRNGVLMPSVDKIILDVSKVRRSLEVRRAKDMLIRKDSAYIVVGGLSGLGWLIVKYLSRMGAKLIVSLSRRQLQKNVRKQFENIRILRKVDIIHQTVDITNFNEVCLLIKDVQQQYPNVPIKGIFQGGGVLKDNTVPNMTKTDFNEPLYVKIIGTWNLHLATNQLGLDIFMMHSSIASVFGNYAQTNYAAANSFIDSFAFYRRSLGLAAQVINWGALEVGMAADPTVSEIFSHRGINFLNKEQITNALTQAIISDLPQCIFADFNLRKFLSSISKKWMDSKFSKMLSSTDILESVSLSNAFKDGVVANSNLVSQIKQVVSTVLMIEEAEIDESKSLLHFGLDSQNAVEIVNLLYPATKVRIPILMLLSGEYSVKELAEYITEKRAMKDDDAPLTDKEHLANKPSPIEKYFFDIHDVNALDDGLSLLFEYEVSAELNNAELWKCVMHYIFQFHPELRFAYETTLVNEKKVEVTKHLRDIEDFTFDFVVLPMECTLEQSNTYFQKGDSWLKDPIKVFYFTGTQYGIIRLICNRIYIDVQCAGFLMKIMQTIVAYLSSRRNPPHTLQQGIVNTTLVMFRKLNSNLEPLKQDWNKRFQQLTPEVNNPIPSNTYSEELSERCIHHYFDSRTVKRVKEFLQKHVSFSLLNLTCLAYQIVLHRLCCSDRIVIMTPVDLRSEFPELQNRLVSCENLIPIISPNFSKGSSSFLSLLGRSKKLINEAFSRSLLPCHYLPFLEGFEQSKHMIHVLQIHELETSIGPHIRLKKIETRRNSTLKTHLSVLYDKTKEELHLDLQFCPHYINQYIAENIGEFLENILDLIMTDSSSAIQCWNPVCKLQQEIRKECRAAFMLFKQNEKVEHVMLELRENELRWGMGAKRKLNLADIRMITSFNMNGYFALRIKPITERDNETILVSKHRRLRDAWVSFIGDIMLGLGIRTPPKAIYMNGLKI